MSGSLDQSLDDIIKSRRATGGRGGRGRKVTTRATNGAVAAPVGGVKKNIGKKAVKPTKQIVQPVAAKKGGEYKVLVSKLVRLSPDGQICCTYANACP